jgi:ABC-type nitrate/sulfonate/bicarbonate transport system permease component
VLVSMVKGLRAPDQMQLDLLKTYGASEGQTFCQAAAAGLDALSSSPR